MKEFSRIAIVLALSLTLLLPGLAACTPTQSPATTGPAGAPTTTASPATQVAVQKIQFTGVYHSSQAEVGAYFVWTNFLNQVKERSGGKIEIISKGGSEVFAPPELLNKCKGGLVDVVLAPAAYWAATVPELGYDGLPYEVDWDGLPTLMDATRPTISGVYDKQGTVFVANIYPAGSFVIASRAPVRKMEDLKGMTLRGHGLMPAILIESLGGSAAVMPSAEVVGALERGVVNGLMATPPLLRDFKVWDLGVKYVADYELAFAFASNIVMSKNAFNKMSPELQKTFMGIAKDIEKEMTTYWKGQEATIVSDLKARGITFYTLPPDEAARWRQATVARAIPTFMGTKGIDQASAKQLTDLLSTKWVKK